MTFLMKILTSPCKIFIKKVIFSFFFLLVLNSVKPQIISWFRSPLREIVGVEGDNKLPITRITSSK